jgi:phosphoribosylaminoimidazolecarboxamide formyltransferase/IMP cyclohydrolase
VHAGLLAEPGNEDHARFLERIGAVYFDMVVVNLYPFESTVRTEDADIEDGRGNIDIGGPTMLRGAAKNFLRVAAVSNPDRYGKILEELDDNEGALSLETRFRLAQETFAHSRRYEEAIADYLEKVDPKSLSNTYLSAGKA